MFEKLFQQQSLYVSGDYSSSNPAASLFVNSDDILQPTGPTIDTDSFIKKAKAISKVISNNIGTHATEDTDRKIKQIFNDEPIF